MNQGNTKIEYHLSKYFFTTELASLNLLKNCRETGTDQREFPRALEFFSISSTVNESLNKKFREKNNI